MSWKGLTKAVQRAPHRVLVAAHRVEETKDDVYDDAQLRFKELEKDTAKLHNESKKYFESIHGMLDHQIGFSRAIAEIYKPISGRASDPDSYVIDSNPEGIRACEEYEAVVQELKANLAPELEMIKSRVVDPADELMEIVKSVRQVADKRRRKQQSYDMAQAKMKKLQAKPDKSAKDESALAQAENEFMEAEMVFQEINDRLKETLPELFRLEREFIMPLFQSFYYMQLNVFYTLHEQMQSMDIGYFNLTKAIEEGFEEKRGDIQQQAEAIPMTKFKTTGNPKKANLMAQRQKMLANGRARPGSIEGGEASPSRRITMGSYDNPPPAYSPEEQPAGQLMAPDSSIGRSASTGSNWTSAAKAKAAPPPPKPKPGALKGTSVETVTAKYTYEAQAEGDLTFYEGDVIEVVTRTDNDNEWWVGKINGKEGQFPANYVQLNS
ncbi:BAR-domain-containing protein [Hortaea werneckii]|nr:BAR-domain-containing protein [Hortaea werneckii]KAI7314096.1 BAR-domain-containing protein [Hortaea werneckii]